MTEPEAVTKPSETAGATGAATQNTRQKSAGELASEAKIRFYTRIFLVMIAFLGAWKAYALLAPTYL